MNLKLDFMKIPKAEDIVLDCLAILSMIFLLAGLVRLESNKSYGLAFLSIGLTLLVVFIIVVVALRKNRKVVSAGSYESGNA